MATTYYDDGSSITYDDNGPSGSTQSPAGYLVSDYSANFSPSAALTGATNWTEVLKYGFGRVVDYKTASLQAQNTPPVYQQQNLASVPAQLNTSTVLLLAGAAVLFLVLSGGGKG